MLQLKGTLRRILSFWCLNPRKLKPKMTVVGILVLFPDDVIIAIIAEKSSDIKQLLGKVVH